MVSFSQVSVMGYIGNDVALRSGAKKNVNYLQLSLSVTKNYKKRQDGKEWQTKTHWIKVMIYGPYSTYVASKVSKGDLIHVMGELHVSERKHEGGYKEFEMYVLGHHVIPIKTKKKQKIEDHNYGVPEDEIDSDEVIF